MWIKIGKSEGKHVLDQKIIGACEGKTWIVILKAKYKLKEAYLKKFIMFFEWKFIVKKKMIII